MGYEWDKWILNGICRGCLPSAYFTVWKIPRRFMVGKINQCPHAVNKPPVIKYAQYLITPPRNKVRPPDFWYVFFRFFSSVFRFLSRFFPRFLFSFFSVFFSPCFFLFFRVFLFFRFFSAIHLGILTSKESPLMYLFSIRQFVRHHIGLENVPGTPGQCLA